MDIPFTDCVKGQPEIEQQTEPYSVTWKEIALSAYVIGLLLNLGGGLCFKKLHLKNDRIGPALSLVL